MQRNSSRSWSRFIKIHAELIDLTPNIPTGPNQYKRFLFVPVYSFMNSRKTRTCTLQDLSLFVPFHEWVNRPRKFHFSVFVGADGHLFLCWLQSLGLDSLCLSAVRRYGCYLMQRGSLSTLRSREKKVSTWCLKSSLLVVLVQTGEKQLDFTSQTGASQLPLCCNWRLFSERRAHTQGR